MLGKCYDSFNWSRPTTLSLPSSIYSILYTLELLKRLLLVRLRLLTHYASLTDYLHDRLARDYSFLRWAADFSVSNFILICTFSFFLSIIFFFASTDLFSLSKIYWFLRLSLCSSSFSIWMMCFCFSRARSIFYCICSDFSALIMKYIWPVRSMCPINEYLLC